MSKDEKLSFSDAKSTLIQNMSAYLNEEIGVTNTAERRQRTRKGKLLLVTDNIALFEFSLGMNHKETVSYLLTDLWRGIIRLDGVSVKELSGITE